MRASLIFLTLLAAAPSALAQASDIPRTSDGRPDLHGFWVAAFITPMERPDGFDLVVPPERVAEAVKEMTPEIGEVTDPEIHFNPFPTNLLEMNGAFRSSTIIEPADGKLPFTALAQAAINRYKSAFDNPEERPGAERCLDSLIHPPLQAISLLIPIQIVQTPAALALLTEDIDPGRIVTMNATPQPDVIRTRSGESRGRWDGDTLVIETDHFLVEQPTGIEWRNAALITEDSRTIERFRPLSADSLLYQFTVEDPSLYKQPWLAEFIVTRTQRPVYEYACHEGNHGIMNILGAARLGKQEEKKPTP
jgi:hypothetical protein